MITDVTETRCRILAQPNELKVMWTDREKNQTIFGMTEKLYEQLTWADRQIGRYKRKNDISHSRLRFEAFHLSNNDERLMYHMLRRRLKNHSLNDTVYYTMTVCYLRGLEPTNNQNHNQSILITLTVELKEAEGIENITENVMFIRKRSIKVEYID